MQLNQIDYAQRTGLLAQDLDRFFNTILLLCRQARRKRLPTALVTCDGRGIVEVDESGAVAVDG